MRLKNADGIIESKTFNVKDHDNAEKTERFARKYMVNVAHAMGIVKNKLRITTDNLLEVMLSDDIIVKLDLVFISLFMYINKSYQPLITLCKTYISSNLKQYIAVYCKDTGFIITLHQFLMGSPMIDHINGDPLDNRISNLRYTNPAHNMTNKADNKMHGIKKTIDGGNDITYTACIRGTGGREFSKSFPKFIHKNNACKLAIQFRKNVLEIKSFADLSGIEFSKEDLKIIDDTIYRTNKYIDDMLNRMVHISSHYLKELPDDLSENDRYIMWKFYNRTQSLYLVGLYSTINRLEETRYYLIHPKTKSICEDIIEM